MPRDAEKIKVFVSIQYKFPKLKLNLSIMRKLNFKKILFPQNERKFLLDFGSTYFRWIMSIFEKIAQNISFRTN